MREWAPTYVDEFLLALVFCASSLVSEHDIVVPPKPTVSGESTSQQSYLLSFGVCVLLRIEQRIAEGDVMLSLVLFSLRCLSLLQYSSMGSSWR